MTGHSQGQLFGHTQDKLFLVRLEFELKLEPLLLYSPAPPATAATATPALC